jgi:hypothetical protein
MGIISSRITRERAGGGKRKQKVGVYGIERGECSMKTLNYGIG